MAHRLGMHTKAEQDQALEMAAKVHREAKRKILDHDDKEALLFAHGYLQAVMELAAAEGAPRLASAVDQLIKDLQLAYYEVKG